MSRRKVSPEVEEVRRLVAGVSDYQRWPKRFTLELVRRLDSAGLIPAAIADELSISDRYATALVREVRQVLVSGESA
jgi:hypothetical protein